MFEVLPHRAPDHRDRAADLDRDVDRLLHPVDVRGERGDEDTSVLLRDDLAERLADDALGAGEARPLGVRRVAEQQVDATIPELGERADVGAQAVDRRVVELPVARVEDAARPAFRGRSPTASGTECDIRTISIRNGPRSIGPESGPTSRSSAAFRSPCSSSFDLTSPSVSLVASTRLTRTSRRR